MLKKKVVACTVNCSSANLYHSNDDRTESHGLKRRRIDLLNYQSYFSPNEVFKGTMLSKSDGQFTLNSEIFSCEEDGRPNDVGYVHFEIFLNKDCIDICHFSITLDFEYEKIYLNELSINEAYQNKGIMKRTLFNIFDILKVMHPESKDFMLKLDQIQHVAVYKFFNPDLPQDELPPHDKNGKFDSELSIDDFPLSYLYQLHSDFLLKSLVK